MATIEIDQFKAGMRRLAASVNVITTRTPDGQRSGLTATAVCSVSATPPTLLVCVNRSGNSHAVLTSSGVFAVNVLALEDPTALEGRCQSFNGEMPWTGPISRSNRLFSRSTRARSRMKARKSVGLVLYCLNTSSRCDHGSHPASKATAPGSLSIRFVSGAHKSPPPHPSSQNKRHPHAD